MAENDGVIELDLDVPEQKAPDKGAKAEKTEEKVASTPAVDDVLADLKKQLETKDAALATSEAGRVAAESTARQALDTAHRSKKDVDAANLGMVTSAIDSVKRETEILESNLANAMSAGDFGAAAKIQTQIGTAAAKLVQLETGKEAMEAEAKREPIRKVDPPRDPVEALASQLSPRSAEWVRAHPDYARDQRRTNAMIGAHNVALGENLVPDTDAYFERVEGILGIRKPEPEGEDESALSEAASATQRRSAPPAAPVSRSGTGNGKRPNTVTLTAEEREVASMNGMTDREYAEQKLKLKKEGRLQ